MALTVSELTIHHGAICAINNVSFTVPQGQLTAVIGANGAGKTTLLRALSGLNKSTHGHATWNAYNLLHSKPESIVRHGVSHVSEGKAVIPELTVNENLELGAIWRKNKRETRETKDQITSIFPRLGERLNQRTDTLSGGERQMLAIGRALMSKPQLLLLDEPSLGLAPLVVEQNAMGALKIADNGIVLNLGKVAVTGTAQSLIADPQVRAAYLGY
jgi:branched-chain amino acid transport system ATP-binding protein